MKKCKECYYLRTAEKTISWKCYVSPVIVKREREDFACRFFDSGLIRVHDEEKIQQVRISTSLTDA